MNSSSFSRQIIAKASMMSTELIQIRQAPRLLNKQLHSNIHHISSNKFKLCSAYGTHICKPHQIWKTRHYHRQLKCRAEIQSYSTTADGNSNNSLHGWLLDVVKNPVRSDYDAIMVLGGGLLADGGLPPWVDRRLDGAAYILKQQQQNKRCPILLLGAGTPHKKSVLDSAGFVLHESTAYATYLMQVHNIPASQLLKETSSYDTVGNGYFSATMHAVPAGWTRIAIITSEFHMLRTSAIFNATYALAGLHHADDASFFSLDYHPVSDHGLFDPGVLEARALKEIKAVETWHHNVSKLPNLPAFHSWLFATHLCYSVSRQHEFGREQDLDPKLAATY